MKTYEYKTTNDIIEKLRKENAKLKKITADQYREICYLNDQIRTLEDQNDHLLSDIAGEDW